MSPLLANIYLHELDTYMASTYLHLTEAQRSKRRQKGQGNYLYVRYADDFVVLCNGTKAEALGMKEALSNVLNQMGLTLSEEKTKVTHITEGFDFLGYSVRRGMGRKGKMAPKVRIPHKAIKKFRHAIREILAPHRAYESVNAKIAALNGLVRGWCEYYRCTSGPSQVFGRLSHEVYYDMAHWLGRKYKLSIPAVLQRFMRDNTFSTTTRKLIMPSEYKAKRFVAHTWHNPYSETDKVKSEKERMKRESLFAYDQLWTGYEDRPGGMDLREEVILTKGTTCYVCGTNLHPSAVEIDHITPRARFKELAEADRMKHLQPICTACHRAKTKTDLKVLSRVR